MTPQELRQLAQSQRWSEDFQRFDDATLQSWIADYWDPRTNRFRSSKVDAAGNQIQGSFDKPDECPPGMAAFGANQCRPVEEVAAITARQQGGGVAGASMQPAAPPKPVTVGKPGELTYTGNPLTDALLYQFNTQRSLATGEQNFGGYQNTTPGDLTGRLLSGGGLIWGAGGTPPGGSSPLGTVDANAQMVSNHWAQHAAKQAQTPPPEQPEMPMASPPIAQQSQLANSLTTMPGAMAPKKKSPLEQALGGQRFAAF
jgi:hypothetical protein